MVEIFKTIPLTQGYVALVSPEDFDRINAHKWRIIRRTKTIYATRRENGHRIFMHREILNAPKGMQVDHRNHDGLDNRRSNIHIVTPQENSFNVQPRSATGFVGVTFHRETGKYQATIGKGTKPKYLGIFKTAREAAMVRDAAAYAERGQLAYFNLPWDFSVAK